MSFDPPPTSTGGGADNSGGSKLASSGSGSGAASSGGSSAIAGGTSGGGTEGGSAMGGSRNQAGTGTDAGSNAGGQGGTAGAGGKGSTAGAGGNGGMAGAGKGGADGTAGAGGTAGVGGVTSCVPKPEVCDGADNNCDTVIDPAGTCPNGCTGATFAGHTYLFCGVVASAGVSLTKCTTAGMSITSINSQAENDFVVSKQKGSSWLGGSDAASEEHWYWADGTTDFWDQGAISGVYQNWLQGQPNDNSSENCLVILQSDSVVGGHWKDLACSSMGFHATCESSGP